MKKLDGVVGWLTEFGYRCVKNRQVRRELVDEVAENAVRTVLQELSHFSKDYTMVVEALARGYGKWNEIKRYVEEKKRRVIYDAELRRYLVNLEKRGYVSRVERGRYQLTDPVITNAIGK